jgi:hypothetical protein
LFPSHRKTGVSGHPPPIIPAVVKTDLNSALPLESNGVCLPIGNANGGPPVMKPQSWVVLISLRLHRLAWLPSPSATTYTSSLAVYRPLQPPSLSLSTVLPCFAISNALHPLCSLTICTAQLSYIQLNQHTHLLSISRIHFLPLAISVARHYIQRFSTSRESVDDELIWSQHCCGWSPSTKHRLRPRCRCRHWQQARTHPCRHTPLPNATQTMALSSTGLPSQ